MTSTAETPIDADLVGAVAVSGSVTPLPEGRAALFEDGRLEIHDAKDLLGGLLRPSTSLALPAHAAAAALGDGAVVAEADRIRRLAADGTTRWELPHPSWPGGHQEPRPPGPPAVRPDGRAVSVLVPAGEGTTAAAGPAPARRGNVLLLLDADSGRVRARRPIGGVSSVVTQRWHPNGSMLALSRWSAWYSWSTWWFEPRHDGLHIRGGTAMREVIDFLPGPAGRTSRALTLRRAERMAAGDDRDELASHEVCADEPVALFDLAEISAERGNDEFDGAFLLDECRLLVTGRIFPPGRNAVVRHWLHDAVTLRPLGRIRYPLPVGWVTPLGDGTWLTRGADGLHRWSLPRSPV